MTGDYFDVLRLTVDHKSEEFTLMLRSLDHIASQASRGSRSLQLYNRRGFVYAHHDPLVA